MSETVFPAWTATAGNGTALVRGMLLMVTTPGIVLFATALGFGALARDSGLSVWQALFLSGTLYALPAQVLLVDQLARGATLAAIAFAVTLTGVRLLPMTVVMMPHIRAGRAGVVVRLLAVHFIAVTSWLEGTRRLPSIPPALRPHYFLGLGLAMGCATMGGTAAGHLLAGQVPPLLSAALLFMTPVYFALSLMQAAHKRSDWLAIGLGMGLAPVLYLLAPGPDLMLSGVAGGTIAYLAGRRPG